MQTIADLTAPCAFESGKPRPAASYRSARREIAKQAYRQQPKPQKALQPAKAKRVRKPLTAEQRKVKNARARIRSALAKA